MKKPGIWTSLVLLAGALPGLVDPEAIRRASALHDLALHGNPFLVTNHVALLYVWAPVVAVSACILFLTPGLLAVLAFGTPPSANHWLLRGLVVSLALVSCSVGAVQSVLGVSLHGAPFAWFVAVLSVPLAVRVARSSRVTAIAWWPAGPAQLASMLASYLAVPFVLLVVLMPKFYWESFNGDGAHAFETTRLLLTQSVPFFAPETGSAFPGLTSGLFAYPGSWFLRLFGELEASVRLPFILYLPVLYAVLSELAARRHSAAPRSGHLLIWLSLTAYALGMAFSATYSPYSADIALPATQDTLLVICALGALLAFVDGTHRWMAAFMALTYLSLPSGLLLLGMWMVAVWLVWRPRPVAALKQWATILVACVVGSVVLTLTIPLLGLPAPGNEYGAGGILRYFAFLQFTDLRRFVWVALPGGLLPALSLLLWRRQDALARSLTLLSWGYFLFFFVQANVSLHHFVPSMLFPIPVLWRLMPVEAPRRRLWLAAAAASGGVAIVMCLPRHAVIDTSSRAVGRAIEDRIGGYAVSGPTQLAGAMLLDRLFPKDWDPLVPAAAYGGSPFSWNYYAHHIEPPDAVATPLPYVLQRSSAPEPPGAHLVAREGEASLYLRDEDAWRADLGRRPDSPPGSRWLSVPRSTLFRSVPATTGPRVFNVVSILHGLGVDTDAVMTWLGVKPPS